MSCANISPLVEKTKEAIDNPREKTKLDRLFLLYQLYKNLPPQRITQSSIDESINRINSKLKSELKDGMLQEDMKDLLNRSISANNMYRSGNRKNIDGLLRELSYLENELLLPPSFPSCLEGLLEDEIKSYGERKLSRGRR